LGFYYEKPVIDADGTKIEMTQEEKEQKIQAAKEKEEQNKRSQTQRDLSQYIAMLIVAIPVFTAHWMMVRKKEKQA